MIFKSDDSRAEIKHNSSMMQEDEHDLQHFLHDQPNQHFSLSIFTINYVFTKSR